MRAGSFNHLVGAHQDRRGHRLPAAKSLSVPHSFRIVWTPHPYRDLPHARPLLRARRERPRRRCAAEQSNELASFHSITSSANARSFADISRSIALAVLRLRTSSNLVGCTTGRTAGFSPLRTRPT